MSSQALPKFSQIAACGVFSQIKYGVDATKWQLLSHTSVFNTASLQANTSVAENIPGIDICQEWNITIAKRGKEFSKEKKIIPANDRTVMDLNETNTNSLLKSYKILIIF